MKRRLMPKLIECLRDYKLQTFFSDLVAGVMVGLVALPLAMGTGLTFRCWAS